MKTIKNWLLKHQNKLTLVNTGILLLLAVINFYFIFELLPTSNDECLWLQKKDSEGGKIYFDFVKFEGVAWQAGIRDGDYLIAINDKKLSSPMDGMIVINSIKRGEYATYTVERDGQILTKHVKIKKLLNFQGIGVILLSSIWLIVGTLVLLGKKEGITQKMFYRIGAYFSLASLFYLMWGTPQQNPTFTLPYLRLVIDITWSIGACFLPFVWLKFFLTFPKESALMKYKYTSRILSITPLVVLVYTLVVRIGFIYFDPNSKVNYVSYISTPLTTLIIYSMVSGLVILFINYLKIESKKERNSIFVILIGYAIGVATIIYIITVTANSTIDTLFNSPEYFTPIILIPIIPISFAYAIFKYSLMDMSDVFKNTIFYGTATISIAASYFIILYLIGFGISSAIGTQYQGLIAGVIFILFALVFQSSKDKFQELITQKFYPEQFAFRKVLLKFSNEISSVVGLDNILNFTNKTYVESLKLKHFGILLWEEENQIYDYRSGWGFNNTQFRLNCINKGVLKILKEKEKILSLPVIERCEFEAVFPLNYAELVAENIYTIIPLQIKGKIIGLLLFGLKYSGAQFSGKDLELLVAASNQTAVSIENARLYNLELENIKLEKELENARKIQESLLPKKIPFTKNLDIAGKMIPAMHVGGDYFDVIKVSDSKTFIIVGDVSGKGLSASFYMSKLQTMMRLFCAENKTPKEILIEVNRIIFDNIDRHSFITISLALFDTDSKTVNICRAGHPPVLVVNNCSSVYYQTLGIGVGLEKGKVFDSTLEELVVPMNKDDIFVFFSDGVSEAMNENMDLFGFDNLKNTVVLHSSETANNIQNAIIGSIAFFRNNALQNDDITIVCVKITE